MAAPDHDPADLLAGARRSGGLTLRTSDGSTYRFVYVAPGAFRMGHTKADRTSLVEKSGNLLAGHNAYPDVAVDVAEGYLILGREVTEGQFEAFRRAAGRARRLVPWPAVPARGVTWTEAVAFCDWLSAESGVRVRLPTEVEWEYACRGPEGRRYPWPDGAGFGAWANQGANGAPRGAGRARADESWCRARDLGGNVSEWCLDLYRDGLLTDLAENVALRKHRPSAVGRAEQPKKGVLAFRTYRGGSYLDTELDCLAAVRRSADPDEAYPAVGFRPVLTFPPPAEPRP